MNNYSKNNSQADKFIRDILPQVSRTFDLAIKFLPRKLGQPVGVAYLLCRIADTFEDSAVLDPSCRKEMLGKYADLLDNYSRFDNKLVSELENAFNPDQLSDNACNLETEKQANLMLVENTGSVLQAANSMPANFKQHVFPRVREMAAGMADYTTLAGGEHTEISFLKDENDWNRYCYYVAGTVGHLLTDIFSDYAGFSDRTREKLHPLGQSFGLGLQKVNILKDAVIDTRRGICFLPQTLIDRYGVSFDGKSVADLKGDLTGLVNAVIEVCSRHFQDSLEYIKIIPHKYSGLRMFLIVPVMLAAGTLRLFADYPYRLLEKGDIKLTRKDVWRLVRRSSYCRFSNRLLSHTFGKIYPVCSGS